MTTPTTVQARFQLRADTAANWASVNPTLLNNEFGLETDTKKLKVGNGSTAWNSLAYFPSIVTGGTVLGNLEIGTTGTLTFEGSTADGFETTLAVTNPTADRTITLPNQSGTVIVSGNASIVNADISATAEIAVSKLADGAARQVLQTDSAGTGVEWTDSLDLPGTLDVTQAATFDSSVTIQGDLTVNGTTTTIDTQNLIVEDKNVIIGNVTSPTDVTADGGGITLKGTTDKTLNWVDSTDSWTSSENIDLASGKVIKINGTEVLSGTALGSNVLITSTNITDGTIVDGDISGTAEIAVSKLADGAARQLLQTDSAGTGVEWTDNVDIPGTLDVTSTATFDGVISASAGAAATPSITFTGDLNTGIYSPGADQVAISTAGTGRLFIDSTGRVGIKTSSPTQLLHIYDGAFQAQAATSNTNTDISLIRAVAGPTGGSVFNIRAADGSSDNSDWAITTNANESLLFNVGGSERLRITSDGKVGVGTSSPLGKTHIQSSSTGLAAVNNAGDELVIENNGTTGMTILSSNTTPGTIYFADSDSAQPGAIQYGHSDDNLNFRVNNGERARIDSSGRLLVGTSSSYTVNAGAANTQPAFQNHGTTYATSAAGLYHWQNQTLNAALFSISKSRGALGTHTVLQSGDRIGGLSLNGSDGTNFIPAASIEAFVDGTPGTDDMPGRLVFSTTADGAGSPTERVRLTSTGALLVGTTSTPVSATSGSVVANTSVFVGGAAAAQYAGSQATITATTGTMVFKFKSQSPGARRACFVELTFLGRASSDTASNCPAAKYAFQLHHTAANVTTLNGATSMFEYTFVRATHFAFTDLGGGESTVTLTNPTALSLSGGYEVKIINSTLSGVWTLESVTVT